jgi:cytochrome c556
MIIRTMLAVGAIVVGITAVAAQQGTVIDQRKALMKRSGEQARIGAQMVKGEIPYDPAKAEAIFAAFADKASKLADLFPADSKTGETRALPAIWEKNDQFKATIAKFASDVREAQAKTKDLDSFKASFAAVGRNCTSCHETFRRPQT